jgi:hypothetical protein
MAIRRTSVLFLLSGAASLLLALGGVLGVAVHEPERATVVSTTDSGSSSPVRDAPAARATGGLSLEPPAAVEVPRPADPTHTHADARCGLDARDSAADERHDETGSSRAEASCEARSGRGASAARASANRTSDNRAASKVSSNVSSSRSSASSRTRTNVSSGGASGSASAAASSSAQNGSTSASSSSRSSSSSSDRPHGLTILGP